MKRSTCGFGTICACASMLAFAAAPLRSTAQQTAGQAPSNSDISQQKIDLDLESTSLYSGLKLLFSQVKANFSIDESFKSLTVTAHFQQVPFRIALETLLKSSSTPLTYRVDSGIYIVVPKVETPAVPEPTQALTGAERTIGTQRLETIRIVNLSPIDVALALGGSYINLPFIGFGAIGGGAGGAGSNTSGLSGGASNGAAGNGSAFSGGQPNNPLLSGLTDIGAIFATNASDYLFIQYPGGR